MFDLLPCLPSSSASFCWRLHVFAPRRRRSTRIHSWAALVFRQHVLFDAPAQSCDNVFGRGSGHRHLEREPKIEGASFLYGVFISGVRLASVFATRVCM